jgi:hypothetical protein
MIPIPMQWNEAYLKECAEDEIALAQLMRFGRFAAPAGLARDTVLVPVQARGGHHLRGADTARTRLGSIGELPRWRRDWVAAGELSTQLGLSTRHDQEDGAVSVGTGNRRRDITERYEDHPSKDAATWAAITRAAVQLLESGV